MSELDDKLKNLILTGRDYPLNSQQRQRIFSELVNTVQQAGCLNHYYSQCPKHLLSSYDEIYLLATQKLFSYVWVNLEKYNPDLRVLQWLNGKLKYYFLDALKEFREFNQDIQIIGLDELDNLEKISHSKTHENSLLISQEIINFIKEDPEQVFSNKIMASHQHINFKKVVILRYEGYSWEELAHKFNCKIPALSNFYQRSLKKFAPIIRDYLSL